MARGQPNGFDANDASIDVATLPSGVTSTTTTPQGTGRSLRFQPASGSSVSVLSLTGLVANPGWRKHDIKFDVLPATTARIFLNSVGGGANLRINPAGTVAVYGGSTLLGTSTANIGDGNWHVVEVLSSTSASSLVRLRIDGVDQVTAAASTSFALSIGCSDTVADTYTMYVDNVVSDDVTWPGPAYVALLLPISDNARAALWVAGSNATTATTNLWEAVNNLPPVGTATSNAVTAAISHEGSAAGTTDDYDANMTTYTSAGIAAGSTINAMMAVVATGEDISTGAKLLTFSIKSNPAQGAFETNFTAGASAVGTYPTNWLITRGTIIQNPSVTVSSSPVMTMRRPETASRRADCCFMGIYVDYTPAVVVAVTPTPYIISQAVQRAANW